jgi:cysteine-rich repeat protein
VYVVVDGVESIDAGRYALRVESAVIECGNGFREQEEECDDGEPRDGDGCSAECTIESNESSSNDTPETADEFVAPRYFGAILPAGDVDVIAVDVSQAGTSILARTEDFSDGACRLGLMDTEVEIIGTDAATVLASNDDRAFDDFCSETQAHNLLAGRYYVRVRAAEAGSVPTFGYALDVVLVR